MEFEFAETPEAFADALRRFLRRYRNLSPSNITFAAHQKVPLKVSLGLQIDYGVRMIRAALISHALCRAEREAEGGEQ